MYKDGKWAKSIIAMQESDGKWGCFHSLSKTYSSPITTEQALRRLERLGFSIEDECIQRAVAYMDDCLTGKNSIPDPREKLHDWDVFTQLMLSTWIRRFTLDNENANNTAMLWKAIIDAAFEKGIYDHESYVCAFSDTFKVKPKGGRFIDFVSFYQISLLSDILEERTQDALLDYVIGKEDGIYYIYDRKLSNLPQCFESREVSRYLAAIELLSRYKLAGRKLRFVSDWIYENRNTDGNWDMGSKANDKIYLPLSDSWRQKEKRIKDCTHRISALLKALEN